MKPINTSLNQSDLFRMRLDIMVNKKDPLIILANRIDWDYFHNSFSKLFNGKTGKPPKSIRLVTGLLILKYVYNYSDYEVIFNLERNTHFQYFCGFFTIQTNPVISRSTLVKYRQKLGEEGVNLIFNHILDLSIKLGILKKNTEKVIVDTTAIEKNIKYPRDIELLEKTRKNLVKEGKKQELIKRDNYSKEGPKIKAKSLRFLRGNKTKLLEETISRQKRMLKETLDLIINRKSKPLKEEKKETIPVNGNLFPSINKNDKIEEKEKTHPINKNLSTQIENSIRLLYQQKNSKNKLYSNHEPQTYCIAKGKAKKKYEYGHKLCLTIDHSSGIILNSRAELENKYDGDTLDKSIEETEKQLKKDIKIKEIYADKGYRKKSNGIEGTKGTQEKEQKIYISGTKSKTKKIAKNKKRRSLIEARISELKRMCRGSINYLKGAIGDKINASLVGLAENIRIIKRHLSVNCK